MHRLSSRVLDALLLLWLVTTITFALIHLAPGDPATLLISPAATAEEVARQRTILGLEAPLPLQYARWIGGVLRGDLGASLVRAEPVTHVIAEALPVSLFLGGVSLLSSFLIGTMLGILQALRVSRRADRVITAIATAVYAAPSFWLALAMVTLFTSGVVWLGLPESMRLPAFGMQDPAADPSSIGWADRWRHAALPLLVLSLPGAAGVSRFARRSLLDAAAAPHVSAAYARGLSRGAVERGHVRRTALTPLVVLLGLTLPGIIAGSVFVEQVFAWPGLGRTMLSAIAARDYPMVLGLTLVYAAAVVIANLLADLILLRLDARRRTA